MKPQIDSALRQELQKSREARRSHAYAKAWTHLERAHILSQAFAVAHVHVHLLMLLLALRVFDLKEMLGQIPRILLAAPGSLLGKAPRGNTGRSNVGIFTPMNIPADLEAILSQK